MKLRRLALNDKNRKWILNIITEHLNIIYFACISFVGLIVRLVGFPFVSIDMTWFLYDWFYLIQDNGGFHSLSQQVGDYNLIYQTIIALLSYNHTINCVYLYKIVSVVFDYLLAFFTACCITDILEQKLLSKEFLFLYSSVLLLPTVVLNSSFWAQCDSIYTLFVVFTVVYLYKQRYLRAFIHFGIALAFKLQAIFLVPFILGYYIYLAAKYREMPETKTFSIFGFGISGFVLWLSGIVAYMNGRDLLDAFRIYKNQTGTYKNMYLHFPSFWVFIGDDYDTFKTFAILLTVGILGLGLYYLLMQIKDLEKSFDRFIGAASWFVWTCILFLPAMHDRYAYMLDILLLILGYVNRRYLKYFIVSNIISLINYGSFLCNGSETQLWHATLYLVAYLHFSYQMCTDFSNKQRV